MLSAYRTHLLPILPLIRYLSSVFLQINSFETSDMHLSNKNATGEDGSQSIFFHYQYHKHRFYTGTRRFITIRLFLSRWCTLGEARPRFGQARVLWCRLSRSWLVPGQCSPTILSKPSGRPSLNRSGQNNIRPIKSFNYECSCRSRSFPNRCLIVLSLDESWLGFETSAPLHLDSTVYRLGTIVDRFDLSTAPYTKTTDAIKGAKSGILSRFFPFPVANRNLSH